MKTKLVFCLQKFEEFDGSLSQAQSHFLPVMESWVFHNTYHVAVKARSSMQGKQPPGACPILIELMGFDRFPGPTNLSPSPHGRARIGARCVPRKANESIEATQARLSESKY